MTRAQVAAEYEVIWDGRLGPREPVLEHVLEDNRQPGRYRDLRPDRALLLRLLEQRREWTTKALRAESGMEYHAFWATLQTLSVTGVTSRPARGCVALVRKDRTA